MLIHSLSNQSLDVAVAPAAGGACVRFRAFGSDVFRPADPASVTARDPLGLSCFPMTPYANRILHGRFMFLGETISLPSPWAPHAVHGFGWRRRWDVDRRTVDTCAMSYEEQRGAWPWRYRSEQLIHLEPGALAVELAVLNLDTRPMPASLGLHPYFPDIGHACLQAETDGVWLTDSNLLPTDWLPVSEAPVSFDKARELAGTDLDNCYTGFGGVARISWPHRHAEILIEAPACRFMQVFTRGADGSFCVEAQTAMPDAVNRLGGERTSGIKIVAPGERFACGTTFRVPSTT